MENWRQREQEKYELIWGEYPDYRSQADGDPVVETAFKSMGCRWGETLIDWGCGKGTPAQKLREKGLRVTGFDIAHNCLDAGVNIPLVVGCLWEPQPTLQADFAFCTDVLEHIPPAHLDAALKTIYDCTRQAAFIQVCTTNDTFGLKRMNPPQKLHLSVMSPALWQAKFEATGWRIRMSVQRGKRWYAVCVK